MALSAIRMSEPPPPPSPLPNTGSPLPPWALAVMALLAGAVTALGAVLWLQSPPDIEYIEPDGAVVASTAGSDAAGAELAESASPTAEEMAALAALEATETVALEPAPAADPPVADVPLRIVAEPPELRVWANTTVRLHLEFRADAPQFDRYVWHFEDGSQPQTGEEVVHTFAESVRDRHVTVEAHRSGMDPMIVSRRLPVERLDVVPLGGDGPADVAVGERKGARLLFVQGALTEPLAEALARRIGQLEVSAVVVGGSQADAALLASALQLHSAGTPLLRWRINAESLDGQQEPLLQIVRDAGGDVQPVTGASKGAPVLSLGQIALTAVDTSGETLAEADLRAVRDGLQVAAAYEASLLLTARPLTLLRDGELIADRAYRLYEYALRHQAAAVISARSGVAYDGRFGGVTVLAVGSAGTEDCTRLAGHDACQPPSATLVEVVGRNRLKVLHLLAPQFEQVLQPRDLPAEVGKVRR